jgi:hypothetical protein
MGLTLLLLGLGLLAEQLTFAGIWVVLWPPILLSAKQSITMPRMHRIQLAPAPSAGTRARLLLMTILLTVAVLITLGLVAFSRADLGPIWLVDGMRQHGRLAWLVLIASIGLLVAWATGVRRLHGYAALAVLAQACGFWLEVTTPIVLTVLGAIILLAGMALLLRFMRTYPTMDSSG